MQVSKAILKEITQELECGSTCYYNPKTEEIIAIPNFKDMMGEEEFNETFGLELAKVEKQKKHLIKLESLESFESFKIMERFVTQLPGGKLKDALESVLANKAPFQNFKHVIDNSDFRIHWFEFKQSAMEKIVEAQLNVI